MSKEKIEKIAQELADKTPQEVLEWAIKEYGERIALANSFGTEDVVLTNMLAKIAPEAKIFTLDTGRLNEETYDVWDRLEKKYDIKIKAYHPDAQEVEELITEKGPYSFREGVENRRQCCSIRKIKPLKRALAGLDAWITGLRRTQSVTRADIKKLEFDETFGIVKVNPLVDWDEGQVWDYIKENDVPYNKLHDRGYTSIGCAPCTRQVKEGADIRSGRWWWESPESKECGIHGNCKRD